MTLQFDVITLFPKFFTSPLQSGLLGKALTRGIASVNLINPRDFTQDKHHRVDDEPFGGGVGMLLKPEPIFAAVESLTSLTKTRNYPHESARATHGSAFATIFGYQF